ncbi:FAD-dependent oxidoreductase [Streptomyces coeruleorubidus]|uniref:FAD-dependent oxidoreductase n=1 Tax=Streptomyces coeruleorubidus TaxID=116188 RepID=UPI003CD00649
MSRSTSATRPSACGVPPKAVSRSARARCDPRRAGHDGHRRLHRQELPWLRRQQVCLGSFIIVTEPLGEELARDIIPKARLIVDSNQVCHYFRLTPDNRLLFGGRARFAPSDPTSDKKSGAVLFREMCEIFPNSPGPRSSTCGAAPSLRDGPHRARRADRGRRVLLHGIRGPRRADGHAHGAGHGRGDGRPPRGQPGSRHRPAPHPLYNGTAWFLPFAGAYYKTLDRIR